MNSFSRILFPSSSHFKARVHTLLYEWLHFACTALFIQYTYIDDTCGRLCISGTTVQPNWPLTIRTVRSPLDIRRIRAMNSSASSNVFNWLIMLRNFFRAAKFFLSFTEASSQNMLNVSKLSSSFFKCPMNDPIFWWFSMCVRIFCIYFISANDLALRYEALLSTAASYEKYHLSLLRHTSVFSFVAIRKLLFLILLLPTGKQKKKHDSLFYSLFPLVLTIHIYQLASKPGEQFFTEKILIMLSLMRHNALSRRLLFFSNFHRRHLPLTLYRNSLLRIVTNMFMGVGGCVGMSVGGDMFAGLWMGGCGCGYSTHLSHHDPPTFMVLVKVIWWTSRWHLWDSFRTKSDLFLLLQLSPDHVFTTAFEKNDEPRS